MVDAWVPRTVFCQPKFKIGASKKRQARPVWGSGIPTFGNFSSLDANIPKNGKIFDTEYLKVSVLKQNTTYSP